MLTYAWYDTWYLNACVVVCVLTAAVCVPHPGPGVSFSPPWESETSGVDTIMLRAPRCVFKASPVDRVDVQEQLKRGLENLSAPPPAQL